MLDLTEIKRLRELKRRYMSINWRDDIDFPYKEYQALRDKWDPIPVADCRTGGASFRTIRAVPG